jgi:hypothetical protein
MGNIRAHPRCFHGRQLLILLVSRKGTTGGGGSCWVFLGNKEGQGGRWHPFYTKGNRGSMLYDLGWGAHARTGVGPQFPNFTSITIQSLGLPYLKINAQITSDLRLVCSTYARKDEEITFPTGPVSYPTKIRFVQNHTNKTDFQNCFPVFPSWLGAGRETM